MNIYYREPTLIEQMNDAISDCVTSKKHIDYFELSRVELDGNWTNFDRVTKNGIDVSYSYKGITIKVKE